MGAAWVFRRVLWCAAALVAGAMAARAQVTITNADMFNQVSQYYMTYANAFATNVNVDVSAYLGSASAQAQAWDFKTGPQDVTNRYDYLAAANTPYGADFVAAGAQMAQQLTNEGTTNPLSWLYFTVDPVKGQLDYGFYDPTFDPVQPEAVYSPALQDFPASIHYGSTWSGSTVFDSSNVYGGVLLVDYETTYSTTDTVDAFGYVTLPAIGLLDCLRVHEEVEIDEVLSSGGSVLGSGTNYVLNYYWLAPGHGMVAQVNSQQSGSIPPDNLPGGAGTFERMFFAYHPETAITNPPPPTTIGGFAITLDGSGAFLQWTALAAVSSYTVEYATNLAGTINWQSLGSTTSNFMLDSAAATPAAPVRFYRVVGLVGSK